MTATASLPADYSLFPDRPGRAGLRIYQLIPAIAIQDHLLSTEEGGQTFATGMAGPGENGAPRRASLLKKLGRETARLAAQAAGILEWAYQKAVLRLRTHDGRVG